MNTPRLQETAFAGLQAVLDSTTVRILPEDVEDETEGERETLPDLNEQLDVHPLDASDNEDMLSKWRTTITGASKGVTDKTDAEYRRLIKQCTDFLLQNKLITKAEDFFCNTPPTDAPMFIIAWIMNSCDDILLNGSIRPASQQRDGYPHAQKMRASMTYAFGRVHGLGSRSWQAAEGSGRMVGNPSVSEQVSTYMISLRNRKVRGGEVATSARAVTSDLMERLYDYNHLPENWKIEEYQPKPRGKLAANTLHKWGGGMSRRALQAIYTLAFLCLLRSDEVLKIRREHIEFSKSSDGSPVMVVTLPFRKTHQGGDIKPFYLHAMPVEEAHLCPVRAMAEWIKASGITSGYLFRKMASGDRPSMENSPMTSEQFLEMFRNNLLDIHVDPFPYGTHSFRRGGCQYLAGERRWPLRDICEWGGWSTEFSNLTIVRYLISWNDAPTKRREDFFDPNRPSVKLCFQCGRSCPCS